MTCLVYGIIRPGGKDLPEVNGIMGQAVRYVGRSGMAAAFAEIPRPIEAELQAILDFETVVESLAERFPIIPVRFGSYFEGPDKLGLFLKENEGELTKLLDLLSGVKEMGIRVLAPVGDGGSRKPPEKVDAEHSASGRQYLVARKKHYEKSATVSGEKEQIVRLMQEKFQGLFTRMKTEEGADSSESPAGPPTGGGEEAASHVVLSAYFLVPDAHLDAFHERFSQLEFEGVSFMLSGPWPPYSFADFTPRDSGSAGDPIDADKRRAHLIR